MDHPAARIGSLTALAALVVTSKDLISKTKYRSIFKLVAKKQKNLYTFTIDEPRFMYALLRNEWTKKEKPPCVGSVYFSLINKGMVNCIRELITMYSIKRIMITDQPDVFNLLFDLEYLKIKTHSHAYKVLAMGCMKRKVSCEVFDLIFDFAHLCVDHEVIHYLVFERRWHLIRHILKKDKRLLIRATRNTEYGLSWYDHLVTVLVKLGADIHYRNDEILEIARVYDRFPYEPGCPFRSKIDVLIKHGIVDVRNE